MFKFFYGKEAEQYLFYRIPQMLFTEEKFRLMSCEAKVLYGLLLDRVGLSRKNGWFDNEGKLYLYYTQDEACEKLNVGKNKVVKIFLELERAELIQRKKQGLGRPTRIYVMNFAQSDDDISTDETETAPDYKEVCEFSELSESQSPDFTETDFRTSRKQTSRLPENKLQDFPKTNLKTSRKQTSGLPKNKPQDFPKTNTNHTDMNHTNLNHTDYQSNLSIPNEQRNNAVRSKKNRNDRCDGYDRWNDSEQNSYLSYIKQNLGYDSILQSDSMAKNILDMAVQIILEVYNPQNEYIVIQGKSYPQAVVRKKFEKLNSTHIRYVWECLQETIKTQKIKSLQKYLQACLFNAPDTIDFYYDNQRQYDRNSTLNNRIVSKNQPKAEEHKPKNKECEASYDISILTDPAYMRIFLE